MLSLFGKKKRISIVPAMQELPDVPSFPVPDETLPEFPRLPEPKPMRELRQEAVFLKADVLDIVMNDIQTVRGRLDKSEKMVARIEEVHDSQGRLLQSWNGTLKEVHDKLLFLDTILFKKGDGHE
ncbi:MAG TPA: hypothetical protein VJK72_01560 [Candidatus Nanoarchaeia archaeon]|nr:hypothetical protein [Candidatus Nanoarchaeia archaeon]